MVAEIRTSVPSVLRRQQVHRTLPVVSATLIQLTTAATHRSAVAAAVPSVAAVAVEVPLVAVVVVVPSVAEAVAAVVALSAEDDRVVPKVLIFSNNNKNNKI